MTNYINVSDVKRVLSDRILLQLTEDNNRNITTEDSDLQEFIESIIDEAEDKINNYLRPSYSVPLTTVPSSIKRYTLNITRFYLYDRRNIQIPENVQLAFDEAIEDLKLLQQNKIKLSVSETIADSDSGTFIKTNKDKDDIMFGNSNDLDLGYEQKFNLDNYA